MSELRLRIELNKGGEGISFHKLAQISVEADQFLKMIVQDVDRRITGTWIAKDFDNASVDFTTEFSGNITAEQVVLCKRALEAAMKTQFDFTELEKYRVKRATLLQYAKIAKPIAPDEAIYFAVLNGDKKPKKHRHVLTKEHSIELVQRIQLTDTVSYDGSVQGIITALFRDQREYRKPHFRLRELYSSTLIPCYYGPELYQKVVLEGLREAESVVHIAGKITASRTERKILMVEAKKIIEAEAYVPGDLQRFIGCAPQATGDLTTEQFINAVRGRNNDKAQNEGIT
jgi:hypothetical protein